MSSPVHNLSVGRRTPLPGFRAAERWTAANSNPDITVYQVNEFLARYPSVLEDYLVQSVSEEFLERVIAKKHQPTESGEKKPAVVCLKPHKSKYQLNTLYSDIGLEELSRRIMNCSTDEHIYEKIFDISRVIACLVFASDFHMYILESTEADIALFEPSGSPRIKHLGPVGYRLTVSAHVAAEKKAINVTNVPQDFRFPKGVCLGDEKAHHVMSFPILLECGSVYGVVEFIRGWEEDPFSCDDFELSNAILSWITACVQKMKLNKLLSMQTSLNNYLLETTKVMFGDMGNIDNLVTNIMMFTKDLVSADRCTLFLVDEDRHELFADYFDEGKTSDNGIPLFTKGSQIRFQQDKGIAGFVAKTGEIVNIIDAYKDDRFNPEIDMKTGYKTRNILCMPISSKKGILGVVQMINRVGADHFTQEDVAAFKMFAVYGALALHYSSIYNMLTHQQTKYKVAMEVLHFHLTCADEEADHLMANPFLPDDKVPAQFPSYDFCCYDYESILPSLFIRMMMDTFDKNMFELPKLCRFVLTVRKNYRPVRYHNWQHGFHVGHSLWVMLKLSESVQFTDLEKMGLIIGGICHDLDHRGYSNDFFQKLKLPLAALYSTSTMEQHHYKQTITILHAEGNDIFSFLTADQHKTVLEMIRLNILATDLATYFPNQKTLAKLIETETFDYSLPEHRSGLISLMMTGADLCTVPKPWETQRRTISYIYDEFFMQGDEEKKRGMKPIPMMDRVNKDEIPSQQVGFISFICKPLFSTLMVLLPETKPLMDGTQLCLENWQMVITENAAKAVTLRVSK